MSSLKENRCYGLSNGKLNQNANVTVFHVKLTDSAARAIATFQNSKDRSSQPNIYFDGNQGKICIPNSENSNEMRIFTFGVAKVACENPNGSFDCVKQLSASGAEELSCLGVIQKKMTVNATDDSYDKARQSMAQAEEETRSRAAIVIKNGGRFQGKKVTVRAPAPALAKLTKPKQSPQFVASNLNRGVGISKPKKSPCPSNRKNVGEIQSLPFKERVMHLLALRPYRRPELMLRLQRDGLLDGDKEMLDSLLSEVGQLSSRDSTYVLKDGLYKDLHKDWPGYTTGDQQLLKRILVRRLFQPQQNLLTVPEAQVSPLRETPNSSPAHRPKHSLLEEYADPPASKKPRISHLSSRAAGEKSWQRTSEQTAPKDAETRAGERQKDSLDPKRLFESLSAVCHRDVEVAKRLQPSEGAQEVPKDTVEVFKADRPSSPVTEPNLSKRTSRRKKSKHKYRKHETDELNARKERKKDQSSEDGDQKVPMNETSPSESLFDSNTPQMNPDTEDYLLKYTVIHSPTQRQNYKQDFNNEYSEYIDLHSRIDDMTRQFMELDTQLKQLHQDSHKYKTVHNKILQKYCKIKKSNPNYNQDKVRCEYLHNKLAHIKKLISDFDQRQLTEDNSGP